MSVEVVVVPDLVARGTVGFLVGEVSGCSAASSLLAGSRGWVGSSTH